MKKVIFAIAAIAATSAVWAACTTHTYYSNGRYVNCTVCCDSRGNCNTSCY